MAGDTPHDRMGIHPTVYVSNHATFASKVFLQGGQTVNTEAGREACLFNCVCILRVLQKFFETPGRLKVQIVKTWILPKGYLNREGGRKNEINK